MKQKTKCNVCGTTESKMWMGCLGGWTLCDKCSKDYTDFEYQLDSSKIVILMEVYFRRGKGEDITFEDVYREKASFKFLTFKDLFKMEKK